MEICSLNGQCGGCLYQGVAYEEQVLLKGEEVKKYIEEKKMKTGRYVGIEGSPAIYRYRNKMEYTFGNLEKGGEMTRCWISAASGSTGIITKRSTTA